MEEIFDTIYLYTSGFYSEKLDNFLYDTTTGYVHVGLVMVITALLLCLTFYYIIKPVRRQMFTWFLTLGTNAIINFVFALYYTVTPLINSQVDPNEEWAILDSIFFGIANIFWSAVFFTAFAFLSKWWSPAKYIPFKKF